MSVFFLRFFRPFRYIFKALLTFRLKLTLSTFALITLKNVSSGFSFLMILPLLTCVGLPIHAPKISDSFSFSFLFQTLHLPQTLLSALIIFSLTMCVTAFIAYQEQNKSVKLQQTYHQYLRTTIYRAIFFARWSFLALQKKSDLIYALVTETQNIALCNHQFLILMNQLLTILVYTALAFYLSWLMTLIAIVTACVLLVLMFPVHRLMSKAGWMHLKANQALQQVMTEQLGAIKLIKSSGFESLSIAQFEACGHTLMQQHLQLQMALTRNKLLYACCAALFLSGLLYIGVQCLAIPIGQFFVLLMIYARLLPMVSSSQQVYQTILHKISSYEHLQELLLQANKHQEYGGDMSQEIQFNDAIALHRVSFKYTEAEHWVFRDLNIQFKKNTTTAIIGPSGVGKTTLVDLVVGLVEPTEGVIMMDGVPLSTTMAAHWRQNIAYMTQDVFLFNTTIRENLLWLSPASSEEALHHVLQLAAAEFVLHLPEGLETVVGDNGVLLSGGERQRLGLARAILQQPALLILDESTNALDQQCVSHIHQSLLALKGKMTIMVISHHEIPEAMLDETIKLGGKF